jgi:hypothetical protein
MGELEEAKKKSQSVISVLTADGQFGVCDILR